MLIANSHQITNTENSMRCEGLERTVDKTRH